MSLVNALAVRFFEDMVQSQDQPKSIVFVVDGSGSVPRSDFDGPMKAAMKSLSKVLHSETTDISVLQFSDRNKIEIENSTSLTDVNKAITKMKKIGSGTCTKSAVIKAREIGESTGKKVFMIIITDGKPNRGEEPDDEVAICTNLGFTVYALGIGEGISEESLRTMCSGEGMSFTLRNYKALEIALGSLSDKNQAKAEHYLRFEFRPAGLSMCAGQPMHMKLHIRNAHPTITIPQGLEIEFEGDDYFYPTLIILDKDLIGSKVNRDPRTETEIDVYLEPKPSVDVDQFPGEVVFNYTMGGIIRRGAITLGTGFLRGDFETDYLTNVLLFGWKGVGKSALLNSLVTCLSMTSYRVATAVAANLEDHVTNNYQKIWIGENIRDADDKRVEKTLLSDKKSILLQIFDPWGDSDKDYNNVTIRHLLQGQIVPGIHRQKADSFLQPSVPQNVIHAVCFVVPLGFVLEDQSLIDSLCTTMTTCIHLGYDPMLVVTRIDDFEDLAKREEYQNMLTSMVPVSPSNIFFHQNYHEQERRINLIDLSSRKILSRLYRMIESKLNQMGGENYYHSYANTPETVFNNENIPRTPESRTPEPRTPESRTPVPHRVPDFDSSNPSVPEALLPLLDPEHNVSITDLTALIEYGVCDIQDIHSLEDEDWKAAGLKPFSIKKIKAAISGMSVSGLSKEKQFLSNLGFTDEEVQLILSTGVKFEELEALEERDLVAEGITKFRARKIVSTIRDNL